MRSRWWFGLAALVMVLAACGGGDSSAAGGGSFCGQLTNLVTADGIDSLEDPESAAEAAQLFQDLADAAPSEIQDDVELLSGFIEAFAAIDPDDEEAAFEAIGEFLAQGDQLEAAGERVERYARDECGIEIDDDGSDAGSGDEDDAEQGEADEPTDEGTGDSGLFGSDSPDTYGDDAALDALWDECEAGDLASCDTLYLTTPFGSEYEEFGSTCGRTREETLGNCSDEPLAGGSTDSADTYGDDPELDVLWDGCDAGVFEDCDTLYFRSPIDSDYEFFGGSCGGRSDAGNGFCAGEFDADQTYGADPVLDALWDGCVAGVLADCDQLYWDSPIGSGYEAFGSTCGDTAEASFGACDSPGGGGDLQSYGDDPALDLLWDECAAGDFDSCDELYFVSALDSDYERFGSTCGETRNPTRGSCTLIDEGSPFDYGDDATLDAYWDDCENGDGAACDELYFDSPIGSAYEIFGETCGDRVEAGGDLCADQIGVG